MDQSLVLHCQCLPSYKGEEGRGSSKGGGGRRLTQPIFSMPNESLGLHIAKWRSHESIVSSIAVQLDVGVECTPKTWRYQLHQAFS